MIGLLQKVLRALFLRAEALFNRAFGDRLNPYYHLGSLAFFLFWIVAGTGLYLYAFFDTSVSGAHQSVESLTHGQWYAGGVLRSVHRYASDAMVVTMAIHLLRHFAFDRLRGFRAFSWLTGVVLLWTVYIAGANGYMLPWDQLAQFVTTATFEWLDWLPMFGGTLSRNFLYAHSVNDRLFSLLVFIHIGVPLGTLLLMWVHVQRVPKAATQPPRPIAIAVAAMLVLLAVVLPVASQGGAARMDLVPQRLELDWFLLLLYPLVYVVSPAAMWAFVLGATAIFIVLPFVPWQRRAREGHALLVRPGDHRVPVRPGETILEAGLRAGLALDFECRSGGCGRCLCTVRSGRFDAGVYQGAVLTEAMRARGEALMCCAVPAEDVEIEVPRLAGATRFEARVVRMQRLAPEVMRVVVEPLAGARVAFEAGQYLNVILEDGQRRAFSFASAPGDGAAIELHIRRIPGGRFTTRVFDAMREGDTLALEGPLGHFTLRESERPILFIAGATGFAPIKSIVEDAFARGVRRPMQLYWGVRRPDDLYLLDLVERWQREHDHFRMVAVVSHGSEGDGWSGRRGLVHEAMLADHPDLSGCEVYACGSVQMVQAAVPAFMAQGLAEDACFSDAFVSSATLPAPA